MNLRELMRYLTGRRWSSKVYATTPNGTYTFDIERVSGDLGGETMLHLKEVEPAKVRDSDGDTWVRLPDGTYVIENTCSMGVRSGISLRSVRQMYGVRA